MTASRMKLGDVFRIGSSKRVLQSQWSSAGVPFYRGREITKLGEDGFVDNELFISEKLYAECREKGGVPVAGDIMVTAIGTIGNSYVVRPEDRFYFKDASVLWMHRVTEVSSDFINYWLKSPHFLEQLDRGNGATVDTLTIQKLQGVQIELPNLPEQHRIVAILDEAFEGIATAKANAEKNLQNARALFDTLLSSVFHATGDVVSLSDCATAISDGDHAPPPKSKTGIPFITISNIEKETRRIDFTDTFFVSKEYFEALKPHRKPKRGDVLYTVTGSFGIPVLVEDDREFCFQRHIGLIRPTAEIDSRWLMYALLSPQRFAQAEAGATGTAQRTVSLSVLRAMTMPMMGLEEQRQIAARLDALSDEIEKLKDIVRSKVFALEELKKSLLIHAFAGRL